MEGLVGASRSCASSVPESLPPGLKTRLIGWLWATFLRLLCRSWRKRHDGFASIDEARKHGHKFLLCFWHGKYIPIMALCHWLWIECREENACVFTSLSARGRVIREICRNFGLDCILIPDHGHKQSYDLMLEALAGHRAGVIAVDGPLGPDRQVKQGAIRLASDLGFHLVPAGVHADRKWTLAKRWDKMEVPKPLSRVSLIMGEPIAVDRGLSRRDVRFLIQRLKDALDNLEDRARYVLADP
ncbi:MAG: lysophospholipid acyltransferase family protein [Gammaproteobacteria bacterium]